MMRSFARTVARTALPGVMNRRYLSRQSAAEIETALLPALVPRGGVAIDVGASRGLYVHHLLRLTRRVIAFEPLPAMQAWLRRRYGGKVELECAALSDRSGTAAIRFPRGNTSWATIAASNRLEAASDVGAIEEVLVETRTLDSYGIGDAGFIKIDVEGAEEAVLRGAATTLASRPVLLIESEERHCAGAPGRVRAMLERLGYRGLFVCDGEVCDVAEFDPRRHQPAANISGEGKRGRYINNFIFVPAEAGDVYRHRLELQLERHDRGARPAAVA